MTSRTRRRVTPGTLVSGMAALAGALVILSAGSAASAAVLRGTVTRVVDGDTISVSSRGVRTTVRLIGIDTPETKRPGYPVQCGGPAASREAARLLRRGTRVRVVSDPSQDARDKYGRFLGYVYRPGRSGARGSVNYRLVRTGFAKTYVYGRIPFRYAGQFLAGEIRAKKARLGVWGPPCNGNTVKPQPQPARAPGSSSRCDANYRGACIPSPPPDLDCGQISARRFRVVGVDVHRFDSDGDGIACEGSR